MPRFDRRHGSGGAKVLLGEKLDGVILPRSTFFPMNPTTLPSPSSRRSRWFPGEMKEAVDLVTSPYGLGATVVTEDVERGERVAPPGRFWDGFHDRRPVRLLTFRSAA